MCISIRQISCSLIQYVHFSKISSSWNKRSINSVLSIQIPAPFAYLCELLKIYEASVNLLYFSLESDARACALLNYIVYWYLKSLSVCKKCRAIREKFHFLWISNNDLFKLFFYFSRSRFVATTTFICHRPISQIFFSW